MKHINVVSFWMPYPIEDESWCIDFLRDYITSVGNTSVIDLGDAHDPNTINIVRNSSLVVIGLPQNKRCLDEFFSDKEMRLENVCYVIMGYYGNHMINRVYLKNIYRVRDEDICVIPHNVHVENAVKEGRVSSYLAQENHILREETSVYKACLTQIGKMIMKKLG